MSAASPASMRRPPALPEPTCTQVQWGKEVVSRFASGLASGAELYTDSNGREMQRRQRDHRPSWQLNQTEPVAGNYFPVNTAAFVRDAGAQLTILTDSSQGGASLASGQIELMVHRRLLHDDARGVGEPLNETEHTSPYTSRDQGGAHSGRALIVRGTHYVSLEPAASAAAVWRPLMDRVYAKPLVAFAPVAGAPERRTSSALRAPLPPNLQVLTRAQAPARLHMHAPMGRVHMDMGVIHGHGDGTWTHLHASASGSADAMCTCTCGCDMRMQVVTLVRTAADTYLLRLAHQFGLGEDPSLSLPATVGYPPTPPTPPPPPPLPHHTSTPDACHRRTSTPFPPSPHLSIGRHRHTLCRRHAATGREHRGALAHGQPAQGKCVSVVLG